MCIIDDHSNNALLDLGGGDRGERSGGFSSSKTNQVQLQMEQEAELQALQERETQIRQLEVLYYDEYFYFVYPLHLTIIYIIMNTLI